MNQQNETSISCMKTGALFNVITKNTKWEFDSSNPNIKYYNCISHTAWQRPWFTEFPFPVSQCLSWTWKNCMWPTTQVYISRELNFINLFICCFISVWWQIYNWIFLQNRNEAVQNTKSGSVLLMQHSKLLTFRTLI